MAPVLNSQTVRLLDVALIGPAMIWGGIDLYDKRRWLAWTLGLLGVATIGYNAVNYWRYSRAPSPLLMQPLPPPSAQETPAMPPPGVWA